MNTRPASQSQTTVTVTQHEPNPSGVIHNLNNLFGAMAPLLRAVGYGARIAPPTSAMSGPRTRTLTWSESDDTQSYSLAVAHGVIPGGRDENDMPTSYVNAYTLTRTWAGDITHTITETFTDPNRMHTAIAHTLASAMI